MLYFAWVIARKDLRIIFSSASSLVQAMLFGLLLIFLFSLARDAAENINPRTASAIFWLSSVFSQILVFNQLFALEETNGSRTGLVLSPAPVQGIWLGKALSGFILLFITQLFFLPATIVFLNQGLTGSYLYGFVAIFIVDIGICALGSLLGALANGQSRESLLSVILFPLLVPLLLAGISLDGELFGAFSNAVPKMWLGLAIAFDAIFIAAGLTLFGFLYRGED